MEAVWYNMGTQTCISCRLNRLILKSIMQPTWVAYGTRRPWPMAAVFYGGCNPWIETHEIEYHVLLLEICWLPNKVSYVDIIL